MTKTKAHGWSEKGFSMIEMFIVIALIAVLSAIALPRFVEWRQNVACRTTAREISMLLREGRMKSIARSRQHQVEFDTANKRFGLRGPSGQGYGTVWSLVPPIDPLNYHNIPAGVDILPTVNAIAFNANGTYSPPSPPATTTIEVKDAASITHYRIDVDSAGRVRVY